MCGSQKLILFYIVELGAWDRFEHGLAHFAFLES
jgi:hypothetical protein